MPDIEKGNKVCLGCQKEYEAHIGRIAGITIEFGRGYCPSCRQKKYDEQEAKELATNLAKIKNAREQWRRQCGIPLRFQTSRFDGFNLSVDKSIKKAWKECKDYANIFLCGQPRKSPSMVFYSRNIWGVGKTYLVCALAHAILDKWNGETDWCPICFTSEPQLFLRVRSTYNRRGRETEEGIYNLLLTVPLLILDDVGKEEVADPRFVQRVLFTVINGRYQNMLPIIITANLDTEGLDRYLGGDRGNSASMDRLAEMTGNTFFELSGVSYRDASKRRP